MGTTDQFGNPTTDTSPHQPSVQQGINLHLPDREAIHIFWSRFRGKGRKKAGLLLSLKNIVLCSWLNIFFVFLPLGWIAHFQKFPDTAVLVLNFLALIPLENLFDYLGDQMSLFLGNDLGDLLIITLNNSVEAVLAIILLLKCELKLLQSTIVGVIILHLLLVPGVAFVTGGAQMWEQNLHPHFSQLNHSLLTLGVLALVLPASFYASLSRGSLADIEAAVLNDNARADFLRISRGIAILLLLVYISSRIYIHNPPGTDNAFQPHPDAPEELKIKEKQLAVRDPEVDSWVGVIVLLIAIALVAVTAEWLVKSVEFLKKENRVSEAWFGLIFLPFVSFAADGFVAVVYFGRVCLRALLHQPPSPTTLAKARSIDLSIQFALFWMPFVVLLGWWTRRPVLLLLDLYEIAVVVASCFLVNHITADAKTNWAEGIVLVAFYLMIAMTTWFYSGQPDMHEMSQCDSVAAFIAAAASGEAGGGH
ncbi:hypothetical protein BDV98DRAFT_500213 [Pterulicium gracile]|uniref:Sodium/calcium exchanger membrane region domain-containing protein n=1 Tax=Pterulicium gracile TaxID=1884261 RepID=A0A5C3QVZ1_9AGAR|nr:hypothetical protein BDV98DRAFT_500213 [Pterula gracilis]